MPLASASSTADRLKRMGELRPVPILINGINPPRTHRSIVRGSTDRWAAMLSLVTHPSKTLTSPLVLKVCVEGEAAVTAAFSVFTVIPLLFGSGHASAPRPVHTLGGSNRPWPA